MAPARRRSTRRSAAPTPAARASTGRESSCSRSWRRSSASSCRRVSPRIPTDDTNVAFFEAYFSNYIEGTEFEVDEAEGIVFDHRIPEHRPEDAHDVLGTFELIDDVEKRRRVPTDPDEFIDQLRADHGVILGHRPSAEPGRFKERPNQVGGHSFVHPDLVNGTLYEGFQHYRSLPEGFPRAVFMMFLIAEVHPFKDGNGRTGRVFMNAELTNEGLQRIMIPISYRDDYLRSLRALSANRNPRPLVRVLEFAQRYVARIEWRDLRTAERMLAATNAFVLPHIVDEQELKLRLPTTVDALDAEVRGARE